MRTLGTALVALGILAVCAGPASSAPMPAEVVGSWSDQPDCGPTARKMVFEATSLSIVQSDGRKNSVTVDTTGQASDRLEIRVTEVSAGEAENVGAPHVGDMIAVRLESDLLHLLARADSGGSVIEVHNAPALHRCKP